MFGNPVKQAVIRPFGTPDILGDFHVTAVFGAVDAYHPAVNADGTKGHQGTDIGDGKCYAQLIAMTTGQVTYAGGYYGIVRIRSDEYPDYEVAVAHSSHILVSVGQHVTQGQPISTLDKVGVAACHGHIGCKKNGVEVDIWPLLDQNSKEEIVTIIIEKFPARAWIVSNPWPAGYSIDFATGAVKQVLAAPGYTNTSSASADQRVLVNGKPYLHITNGVYANTYVPEGVGSVLSPAGELVSKAQYDADVAKALTDGREAGIKAARDDLADLK